VRSDRSTTGGNPSEAAVSASKAAACPRPDIARRLGDLARRAAEGLHDVRSGGADLCAGIRAGGLHPGGGTRRPRARRRLEFRPEALRRAAHVGGRGAHGLGPRAGVVADLLEGLVHGPEQTIRPVGEGAARRGGRGAHGPTQIVDGLGEAGHGGFHLRPDAAGALVHARREFADAVAGLDQALARLGQGAADIVGEAGREVLDHAAHVIGAELADLLQQRAHGCVDGRGDRGG
jgi:hypothetical protein